MVEDEDGNLDEVRKLYPDLSDEQLRDVHERYRRYVRAVIQIYERVRREQGPEAANKLAGGK